jgi:hypothetical protein
LGAPLAIIDKRREEANVAEVMNVVGEVSGRHCLLVDDLIDTAGTLVKGAEALLEKGAAGRFGLRHPCRAFRTGSGEDREVRDQGSGFFRIRFRCLRGRRVVAGSPSCRLPS